MKKIKSSYIYFFSIMIALIILIISPGTSMAQTSSHDLEQEYRNKANQFFVDKNYEQAALVLEELLAKNPELNNETVYRQLTHIYDNYLFNFEKALSFYEMYLVQFPEGKFSSIFRERVAYLNERRSEWQALRDFRKIQLEEDNIRIKESLKEVETIVSKNENGLIAPEMHIYLTNKYFETTQYQKARMHAEKYINSFDKVSMSSTYKAQALNLYSDILIKQHSFGKAIRALDQVMVLGNPEESFNYAVKKNNIINQRNMWYGFVLSLLYFISVVILLIPIKFWQHFNLQNYSRQIVAPLLLLALISLGPVLILIITGEQEADLRFFFSLLGLSILSLMIIRLLAPLSLKTGRLVYILISCLHMAVASFMTYYMIVYTPV
ncbi:MAG: tetratricopeptide repeat protein [Bacillota bacterium]